MGYKVAKVFLLLGLVSLSFCLPGVPCQTPNRNIGECIDIIYCPPLNNMLSLQTKKSDTEFLKQSSCGFNNFIPKVCCPINLSIPTSQPSMPNADFIQKESTYGHGNNNFEKFKGNDEQKHKNLGQKVIDDFAFPEGPQQHPKLEHKNSHSQENDNFEKKKGNDEQKHENLGQKVIDNRSNDDDFAFPEEPQQHPKLGHQGSHSQVQSDNFGNQQNNHSEGEEINNDQSIRIHQLLPNNCGSSLGNRIFGGDAVELNEYPWLSLLEYRKTNGKKALSCGGAIINDRYVLTAAHCVVGSSLPKNFRLESVRLGEYNTTSEYDCIPNGYNNSATCVEDPPLIVPIEEQIVHENYDPPSIDQRNDIALLRLAHKINFSPYIQPICLPSNANIKQDLSIAGWGSTETAKYSDVKLKVDVPLLDLSQCSSVYQRHGINLGRGQMCAGGETGKDSCRGDSGGPLVQLDKSDDGVSRWMAVGVVSFGPSPCGLNGFPGVYSRVYDFLPWIISKLKP